MNATRVKNYRETIDECDQEIASLLIKRRRLSQSLQRLKISDGQPSVDLARECEVIGHYRTTLGPMGDDIAHYILTYSKEAQVH